MPGTVDQSVLVLLICRSEFLVLGTAVQGSPRVRKGWDKGRESLRVQGISRVEERGFGDWERPEWVWRLGKGRDGHGVPGSRERERLGAGRGGMARKEDGGWCQGMGRSGVSAQRNVGFRGAHGFGNGGSGVSHCQGSHSPLAAPQEHPQPQRWGHRWRCSAVAPPTTPAPPTEQPPRPPLAPLFAARQWQLGKLVTE